MYMLTMVRCFAKTRWPLLLALFLISNISVAAPGTSNRGDTPIDQRNWERMWNEERNTKATRYNKIYQQGKKIYQGKGEHKKYDYCVPKVEDANAFIEENTFSFQQVSQLEKVALSKKTLLPFKFLKVKEFATVLYDCDEPDALVLNKLAKEDAGLVIYYLHGKYSLRLKQEGGGGKLAKTKQR